MNGAADKIRVAILGASGYTGAETIRLAVHHPNLDIVALTAERRAGQDVGTVFPHLAGLGLPELQRLDEIDWSEVDAVFCCLPHGTTQAVVAALPDHLKVIDLSADFRLGDPGLYEQVYGQAHQAPALQRDAVYGLTEIARDRLRATHLVACPGCYPTAALLPLLPLVEAGQIDDGDIVIDAKSGVSGAGRTVKEATLFTEVAEGIHAYGIAGHRHGPEIEQELSMAAGAPVTVSFTPHLVPMNRGILASIYVRLAAGAHGVDLRQTLLRRYQDEPFIRVVPQGTAPATRHVRGSNYCLIGVFEDRVPGRAILLSAIDNLVKGAAGQAVQNLNLVFGLPETAGLACEPMFP